MGDKKAKEAYINHQHPTLKKTIRRTPRTAHRNINQKAQYQTHNKGDIQERESL